MKLNSFTPWCKLLQFSIFVPRRCWCQVSSPLAIEIYFLNGIQTGRTVWAKTDHHSVYFNQIQSMWAHLWTFITTALDLVPRYARPNHFKSQFRMFVISHRVRLSRECETSSVNMAIDTISRQCMYLSAVFFLVIASASLVESQLAEKLIQNPCVSKTSCRDCIQTKSCAWCLQPDFGDKPRCFQPSLSPLTGGCQEEYTWNPDHEEILVSRKELTRGGSATARGAGQSIAGGSYEASSSKGSYSSSGFSRESYSRQSELFGSSSRKTSSSTSYGSYSESGEIVQIYPQRVKLKLRISKSFGVLLVLKIVMFAPLIVTIASWIKFGQTSTSLLVTCTSLRSPIHGNLLFSRNLQTKSTVWTFNTRKLKITRSISTTWWTCPNPWKMIRKNCPGWAICCPIQWETSPPTSV